MEWFRRLVLLPLMLLCSGYASADQASLSSQLYTAQATFPCKAEQKGKVDLGCEAGDAVLILSHGDPPKYATPNLAYESLIAQKDQSGAELRVVSVEESVSGQAHILETVMMDETAGARVTTHIHYTKGTVATAMIIEPIAEPLGDAAKKSFFESVVVDGPRPQAMRHGKLDVLAAFPCVAELSKNDGYSTFGCEINGGEEGFFLGGQEYKKKDRSLLQHPDWVLDATLLLATKSGKVMSSRKASVGPYPGMKLESEKEFEQRAIHQTAIHFVTEHGTAYISYVYRNEPNAEARDRFLQSIEVHPHK